MATIIQAGSREAVDDAVIRYVDAVRETDCLNPDEVKAKILPLYEAVLSAARLSGGSPAHFQRACAGTFLEKVSKERAAADGKVLHMDLESTLPHHPPTHRNAM